MRMINNLLFIIAVGLSFYPLQLIGVTIKINPVPVVRHFGENCSDKNKTELCDVKETLTCINGTCACSDPLSMVFDPARGMCAGKAGNQCLVHLSEVSVPSSKRIGSCVTFASCEVDNVEGNKNKNSTCRCWSSFYPDESSGFCIRRREYLQNCDRDEQCNNRKGFICNKDVGVCTCDTTIHRYNPDSERCIGLPNRDCANIYQECTENHKCKSGICRCKFKEVEAVNGTLLCEKVWHKYAKSCGRFRGDCGDEPVNSLRCLDGKCRCKNPDYQTYDFDRRMCVSKVGGPCSITPPLIASGPAFRNNSKFNPKIFPSIQCISYAHCVSLSPTNSKSSIPEKTNSKTILSSRGACECGESFIETKKGMCSLPFGSDCDTSPKNKKDECAHPMKCVAGRCGCPNEVDVYEPHSRKCSKSLKSLCWKDSSCVKNAICKQRIKTMPGRCQCMSKFKATPSATCA